MPLETSPFRPAWWLPGAHAQTLWPYLCRRLPSVRYRRERLELPDGDFLDLDWHAAAPVAGPLVLVLHGLEGCSRSGYARGLVAAMARHGWRGVVMNFRGRSGEPNRLPRSYNAGDTRDLAHVVEILRAREPHAPLACVGYSLGGNMLLKWLGESGSHDRLRAAVAVSVPFLLEPLARRMQRGLSRAYLAYFMRLLRRGYRHKFTTRGLLPPYPLDELHRLRDFFAFDERITAPLHGYAGIYDYYRRASCRQYLPGIRTPTLILHAADDPFMVPEVVPAPHELPETVTLELSPNGGHVGFVSGPWPWHAEYWLERRIPAFLAQWLPTSDPTTEQERETAPVAAD
ncbi:MAG TPA: hydrolase [Candidatus Competibacteraceae bacterium]|nr:hydrolase [Candidatus Competibacteraceae bacterium]